MHRIPFEEVLGTLSSILHSVGFSQDRAAESARLFAETTCDGVYSHGVNRFTRFIATIRNGSVDPTAEPVTLARSGTLERWDGRQGAGNLNALAAMTRAIALAGTHGMGCVALRNTNHWMRGGTYGWKAAEAGMIGVCWTNTMPNLPPWGSVQAGIGNNPLILAVPRKSGHLVLDMAMSQFSYGALESYRKRGEPLPLEGGYDQEGRLTRDAASIEASQRPLPAGFWKGSGLAIMLDLMAATLADGKATHQIDSDPLRESSLSQVFLAINPNALGGGTAESVAEAVVASLHAAAPVDPGKPVRYPGENTLRLREENRRLGLPIEAALWDKILAIQNNGADL